MATKASILAIVRASRPNFRNPNDKIAFLVHAAFLLAGYSLIATGDKAFEENPPTDGEEIGIDGWNSSEDGYAFGYVKYDSGGKRSILVKCIAIGFALVVDVLNLKDDSKEPLHVQINIKDHVKEEDKHSNYTEMYKNLLGLVQILNTGIFSKLDTNNQSWSSTGSCSKSAGENRTNDNAGTFPYEHQQPPQFLYSPPIPSIGGGDLYPGPCAGVLPTSGWIDDVSAEFAVEYDDEIKRLESEGLEITVDVEENVFPSLSDKHAKKRDRRPNMGNIPTKRISRNRASSSINQGMQDENENILNSRLESLEKTVYILKNLVKRHFLGDLPDADDDE